MSFYLFNELRLIVVYTGHYDRATALNRSDSKWDSHLNQVESIKA